MHIRMYIYWFIHCLRQGNFYVFLYNKYFAAFFFVINYFEIAITPSICMHIYKLNTNKYDSNVYVDMPQQYTNKFHGRPFTIITCWRLASWPNALDAVSLYLTQIYVCMCMYLSLLFVTHRQEI